MLLRNFKGGKGVNEVDELFMVCVVDGRDGKLVWHGMGVYFRKVLFGMRFEFLVCLVVLEEGVSDRLGGLDVGDVVHWLGCRS